MLAATKVVKLMVGLEGHTCGPNLEQICAIPSSTDRRKGEGD